MPENLAAQVSPRNSRPRLSVARTFAEAERISHAHAQQLIKRSGNDNLHDRLVSLTRAFNRARRPDLREAFFRAIDEERGIRAVRVRPELATKAQRAEAAVDQERTLFLLSPVAERDAMKQDLDRCIVALMAERDAL